MAKHTWYCDRCGKAMDTGYEAVWITQMDMIFCCRKHAEEWIQDPSNTDSILDSLDTQTTQLDPGDYPYI